MTYKHPATATGWALLNAADAAAARAAIGASNLTLGTTSTTAKAGDYQPNSANISDSTATGRSLLTAADKAAAKAAINANFYVNVKDYGAVGDGVANDTVAIHAARNAAGVGGVVFFPNGTYNASTLSLNVANQTWLLNNATLKYIGSDYNDLLQITAPEVTVIGGVLDMVNVVPNPNQWNGSAIGLDGRKNLSPPRNTDGAVIHNVTIKDAPGNGIWALSTNNLTVTNCTIIEQYLSGIYVSTNQNNESLTDFLIEGNTILSPGGGRRGNLTVRVKAKGIMFRNDNNTRLISRARIINNTIVSVLNSADPSQECINSFWLYDSVIANNITYGGKFGISVPFSKGMTISGNVCRAFGEWGIEIAGDQIDVTVFGNTLDAEGYGDTGIEGSGHETGTKNVAIVGNTITGLKADEQSIGIGFGSEALIDGVTITGNVIAANDQASTSSFFGIYTNCPTTNLTISGNLFKCSDRPGYGIGLLGFEHVGMTITGNNFYNFSVAVLSMGIGGIGYGTFDHIRYTDNMQRNCGPAISINAVAAVTNFVHDVNTTQTVTAATTLVRGGEHVVFLSGANGNVTLPTAVSNTGKYTLKNIHSAAKTVGTTSSQTINGAAASEFSIAAGATATLISDGSNWQTI